MRILVTGGCGYIGSHIALALVAAGHQPILLDNFSNSSPNVADRLGRICGQALPTVACDVRDRPALQAALSRHRVASVIHCAALKAVAQSVDRPLDYHANNVGGLLSLLQAMDAVGLRSIVFSSSATVYGEPRTLPIDETHPTSAANPYGQTKLICENILSDLVRSGRGWRVCLLRYFNPIGAHRSGLIGDDPSGAPNNIMPIIARVASGRSPRLPIFGTDFPTADGTAVRDYIHVVDLAEGHVAALGALASGEPLRTFNLGTGRGTSVRQLVDTFERVTGVAVPTVAAGRRRGDVPALFAAVERARDELGWTASRGLDSMCADSWRFAKAILGEHPAGAQTAASIGSSPSLPPSAAAARAF